MPDRYMQGFFLLWNVEQSAEMVYKFSFVFLRNPAREKESGANAVVQASAPATMSNILSGIAQLLNDMIAVERVKNVANERDYIGSVT